MDNYPRLFTHTRTHCHPYLQSVLLLVALLVRLLCVGLGGDIGV
jgi:hypothetical protein